jgi:hypothetical protein
MRSRTANLRRARAALSQLSYSPLQVGSGGFEPPTLRLSGVRSNQLSYEPLDKKISEYMGEDSNFHLRKEVIQPHLPVRLPCYDFAPVISLTFGGSPPKGLGHRLRVLPTSMA